MSETKYTYWLRSGVYSGMQKVAVLLFGIGSLLLLTRWLSKPDMGVWNLFLLFAGVIEIVRQSLIKNAVIKYINSHGSDEHPRIQSAALAINITITVIICTVNSIVRIRPKITRKISMAKHCTFINNTNNYR